MPRVRVHKLIAASGMTSRRKAEDWILAGRVRVNGEIVRTLGTTVDPDRDEVRVGGTLVRAAPKRTVVVHKPAGYITTSSDPQGRPTVMDLLPRSLRQLGLQPVGRLDRDADGLILLTNDGDLSQRVAHPRSGCEKEYRVRVQGRMPGEAMDRLRKGVVIDGRRTAPCKVRLLRRGRETTEVTIVLREGRNRQVKRMMEAVGHRVTRLRRIRIGRLQIGRLRRGGWREIRPERIRRLFPTAAAGR